MNTTGEGAVAYFTSVSDQGEEEILSLGKMKTFEYRFLRKLREKLKMNEKVKKDPASLLKAIEKESNEIIEKNGNKISY